MDRNKKVVNLWQLLHVATREGGVDRNALPAAPSLPLMPSPPARVAWIETLGWVCNHQRMSVATREGGVDRNASRLNQWRRL